MSPSALLRPTLLFPMLAAAAVTAASSLMVFAVMPGRSAPALFLRSLWETHPIFLGSALALSAAGLGGALWLARQALAVVRGRRAERALRERIALRLERGCDKHLRPRSDPGA